MDILYAPWRSAYASDVARAKKEGTDTDECVFCTNLAQNEDEKYFIFKRYKHCVVKLNLFPYNAGHLLVMPLAHHMYLDELAQEVRAEMMELISASRKILADVLDAQGANIGFNVGKVAGAGMPSHIHAHVLPRWSGDTNFLPLLAQTKQISFDLREVYQKLKPAFEKLII